MGDNTHVLDDKYTDGIWYDRMAGDFCEIQESTDGERVELVNPESGTVYWDMPVKEWVEDHQKDFIQVLEEAVDDPVDFYRATVDTLVDATQYQHDSWPLREEISFRYARQQVEIVEA